MAQRILIRFIKTPGFVTDAIAFVTNSRIDHVEFGIEDDAGNLLSWLGAHASGGIEERPPDYCKPTREYRYGIPCTDLEYEKWLTWSQAKIGTQYNFEDIAGLLFHDRHLSNPKGDICSQFCCVGLLVAFGADRVLNVLQNFAYLITPETLHLSPILVGNLIPGQA